MLRYRFLANCLAVRRSFSSAREGGSGASEQDLRDARSWLAALDAEAIPLKSIGELSFSRSSGPGGQNVNKYDNTLHWRQNMLRGPKGQFEGYFKSPPRCTAAPYPCSCPWRHQAVPLYSCKVQRYGRPSRRQSKAERQRSQLLQTPV
jgi:hypothetical protein